MVRKGMFWTIVEQTYFVYYPIISYQKIKVYRVEKWIWEDPTGTMVSVENTILVSTMVLIVQDKILW